MLTPAPFSLGGIGAQLGRTQLGSGPVTTNGNLVGVQISESLGILSFGVSISANPSGVQTVSSLGTLFLGTFAQVTGVSTSSVLGSVSESLSAGAAPGSCSSSFQLGVLGISGTCILHFSSPQLTFQISSAAAGSQNDANIFLGSVLFSSAAGVTQPAGSSSSHPTGASGFAIAGSVETSGTCSFDILGVQGASEVSPVSTFLPLVIGVQSTASAGFLLVSSTNNFTLSDGRTYLKIING